MRHLCLTLVLLALFHPEAALAQRAGPPVAILLPGAGGAVPSDVLIRNEDRLRGAGIETVVVGSAGEAAAATDAQRRAGRKVVIVGMSRGAIGAARALAAGAAPDGAVFVSGGGDQIMDQLGSPSRLPATLVVHHRRDGCRLTSPEAIQRFAAWSSGRARIHWVETVGRDAPNPCGPFGAHGFYQDDGPAMAAIIGFIRSR